MTYLYTSKNENRNKEVKGVATMNILVILGLFIILAVFLVESNNLVGKNYQLRNYEKRLAEQEAMIKKMEITETEQSLLGNLEQAAKNFNLVTADKIKYLPAIETSVAIFKN